MSNASVVVFGAGGHGKVVADILLSAGEDVAGFIDDGIPAGELVMGIPVLGPRSWLRTMPGARIALGVGSNSAREQVARACHEAGAELVTAVHPSAVIARTARLGGGTVVMALVAVNSDAVIGRGAILNTACVVEHDCTIGDFAHVSPNAALAGNCKLGARAHLGIAATMLPGTSVGDDTVVGGAALVTSSLPANIVALGVPARPRTR